MSKNGNIRARIFLTLWFLLLAPVGAGWAATYTLPGGPLPSGCTASGAVVTCPGQVSLGNSDQIILAIPLVAVTWNIGGLNADANNILINADQDASYLQIVSSGNIEIKNGVVVKAAISAVGNIEIKNNGSLTGDITGQANVSIGQNATIFGNINAEGDISIGSNAQITGNIVAGGEIQIGSGSVINGYCLEQKVNPLIQCNMAPSSMDHIRIEHDGEGLTCMPESVTVRACADAACSSEYTIGNVTVTLSPSGWVGSATINFTGGHTTAQLGITTAGGITLAASNISPPPTNGVKCYQGASETCALNFVNTGFIFAAALDGAEANVGTQVAGTAFGPYWLRAIKTNTTTKACESALAAPQTVNFSYACADPTACSSGNLMTIGGNPVGSSATPLGLTFDGNGNASLGNINYLDVGKITLVATATVGGATLSGTLGGVGGSPFVVKPHSLVLTDIKQTAVPNLANPAATNASGNRFVSAGESFSATVTAVNASCAASLTTYTLLANIPAACITRNYGKETTPETVTLTGLLKSGLGLTNNPALSNPAAFGTFSGGSATGTTFSWKEVGIITLTPSIGDGNYLGAGDVSSPTVSGNVGRFYAAKFGLSAGAITPRADLCPDLPAAQPAGCPAGFTYMGEPLHALFTLTALATDGTTQLQNYAYSATAANNFAKLDPMAAVTTGTGGPLDMGAVDAAATRTPFLPCGAVPAHPCLLPLQATAGTFVSGMANVSVPFSLFRSNAPTGPFATLQLGVAPQDSDGAVLAAYNLDTVNVVAGANNHAKIGSNTAVRFGHLWLGNAYGSDQRDLTVPFEVQYWSGSAFVKNTADSLTVIASANIGLKQNGLTSTVSSAGPFTVTNGAASFGIARPTGAAVSGSVDIVVALGSGTTTNATWTPTVVPTAGANLPWLRGKWYGTNWDRDPTARATFGIYGGKTGPIYIRENY